MPLYRRSFLLGAAGAAAAYAVPPADQVTLGVIGSGGRGTFVMTTFQKDAALRVGGICDVYEPNLENALSVASKTPGTQPKAYRNYKELLADKDIQAVLIATPGALALPDGAGRAGRRARTSTSRSRSARRPSRA